MLTSFDGCTSLTTVYYGGTKEQWDAITIGSGNEPLHNANIIFAKESPENPDDPTPTVTPGDLNGDGKLNSRDVIAMLKLVISPNPEVSDVTDLNGDGKLNARDVIALMKLVLAQ